MKKIITVFVCALMALAAAAQPANLLALAQTELQKRGLEESAVRARLLEEGIDVDNIPTSEYPAYQGRVMSILDKMQAEKAAKSSSGGAASSATSATATSGSEVIVETAAETITVSDIPQTTLGEVAAEQALQTALEENNVDPNAGSGIYGHSLFTGQTMDVFRTTDGAQAPDTYVLGEGDEVHISIFGSSQTEIHQRIVADGSIQPAGSSKIFLKGLTLAQARNVIRTRLSQFYSFRPDQIAVTLTTARTVTVSIYGEVGVQGGFTLSALNTVFNAMMAAGGPTAIGSIREIQLSRSGKTRRLDFYKYMTNPDASFNYDIQNGDVIFIPVAQKIVSIQGPVHRPMSYEMLEGETLKDLIQYAGGITSDVLPDFVQIERKENGEINYLEYDLKKVLDGSQKVSLLRGDIVRLRATNKPLENFVSINGDVYYGGNYDVNENSSLLGLIKKAEPRYSARKDYVFVERTYSDETVEVLTVPFPGENGNPDFKLQARDQVRVLELAQFQDRGTLTVKGDVRTPFTREFGRNDSMTLSQAIEYADGVRYTARKDYVFVERTKPDETVEVLTVPFPGENGNPDFVLQSRDVVTVLALSSYRDTETITVSGQVRSPFSKTFGLNDRMTVSQAIEYAGGLRSTVYPVAYIFRRDITNPLKRQYIPIEIEKAGDTLLEPGDELRVYDNTTYTNIGEVRVSGAVKNPVSVSFNPDLTMHDLISMAGGFEVGAAYDRVEVFRQVISKTNDVTFDNIVMTVDDDYNCINPNFQIQPYDHIVVRRLPSFSEGRVVEINGRVKYPGTYVMEDSRTQLSEIIKLAGGLLDDADPYTTIFRTYKGRGNIAVNLDKMRYMKGSINHDPYLMEGDVINVRRQENTVTLRGTATRMAQYVPEDFQSLQKNVVYQGRKSAKWYIDNYAGGMERDADRRSVTVTLPNYQSVGTKRFLGFYIYPTVEPGSTITLRTDMAKREKMEKPKEKVDWERIASSSLSALTSIVSMILLIERLN